MEDKGRQWYERVEEMGGSVKAMESGFYLKEMAQGMLTYQQELESGERSLIGVNRFALEDEEVPITLFKPDPKTQERQIQRLNEVKKRRTEGNVQKALEGVRRTAEKKASGTMINIIPSILAAVKERATVGEIFSELREVFGEYEPSKIF